jgi:hypothetical protein
VFGEFGDTALGERAFSIWGGRLVCVGILVTVHWLSSRIFGKYGIVEGGFYSLHLSHLSPSQIPFIYLKARCDRILINLL